MTRGSLARIPFVLLLPLQAQAADDGGRMGPIDGYLMPDRTREMALARSAAPPPVGEKAGVFVLESTGYRELEAGSNGFTCLVGRSWTAPLKFGDRFNAEFWSARVRAPMCLNAEAVRSILPNLLMRTRLALKGASLAEIDAALDRGLASGELKVPQGVAMSFMFSREQFLGEHVAHFMPHVMLYAPYATSRDWGSLRILEGWPGIGEEEGAPHALVLIPVGMWSDGTPAATHPN